MSIFSDNITNEPDFIADGRKWMIDCIHEVCYTYFNLGFYFSLPKLELDGLDEKRALVNLIRDSWNSPYKERFHIRRTNTSIRESKIPGYKYEVIVEVNFDWSDDPIDYVPFVNIPICKL